MTCPVRGEVLAGQDEEPGCWLEASPIFVMLRMSMLELEMDEPSGQLDQALVKSVVGRAPAILQPEMLQHIMGLVVPLFIEAFKIS